MDRHMFPLDAVLVEATLADVPLLMELMRQYSTSPTGFRSSKN